MAVNPNSLCQIEIPVSDLDQAGEFYKNTLGWKPVPAEMHQYVILGVPDDCPFGIALIPSKKERSGDSVVIYFAVDDPREIVARFEQHGGKLRFGPKKLGVYGDIYQVEDPDGNRIGLYQNPKTSL